MMLRHRFQIPKSSFWDHQRQSTLLGFPKLLIICESEDGWFSNFWLSCWRPSSAHFCGDSLDFYVGYHVLCRPRRTSNATELIFIADASMSAISESPANVGTSCSPKGPTWFCYNHITDTTMHFSKGDMMTPSGPLLNSRLKQRENCKEPWVIISTLLLLKVQLNYIACR